MNRDDAQLESLLREHLSAKLDGQLGRSTERFLREVDQAEQQPLRMRRTDSPQLRPVNHRRNPWSVFAWSIGLAGGAVAAGMAIVMILGPMLTRQRTNGQPVITQNDRPTVRGPIDPSPDNDAHAGLIANTEPQNVEHALSWRTLDQGTVYLGGEMPLRSVVRQADETVRWYDPQRKAHVELTVPRDEVMLVGYGSQ